MPASEVTCCCWVGALLDCVPCWSIYVDDRIINRAWNATSEMSSVKRSPSKSHYAIISLWNKFSWLHCDFLRNRFERKKPTNMAGHVIHTYFHDHYGFGKPLWNIPLFLVGSLFLHDIDEETDHTSFPHTTHPNLTGRSNSKMVPDSTISDREQVPTTRERACRRLTRLYGFPSGYLSSGKIPRFPTSFVQMSTLHKKLLLSLWLSHNRGRDWMSFQHLAVAVMSFWCITSPSRSAKCSRTVPRLWCSSDSPVRPNNAHHWTLNGCLLIDSWNILIMYPVAMATAQ